MVALSVHGVVDAAAFTPNKAAEIRKPLRDHFGIDHATIQLDVGKAECEEMVYDRSVSGRRCPPGRNAPRILPRRARSRPIEEAAYR